MNAVDPPASRPTSAPGMIRISPIRRVLRRAVFGLLFVLPILLTVLVVYQLYLLLDAWIIQPVAWLIIPEHIEIMLGLTPDPEPGKVPEVVNSGEVVATDTWSVVKRYVTPPISLVAVLLLLYFLGYAFQTRLNHWVDWIFGHIPGVSILYRAIRDASLAMQGPDGLKAIDTVVLVPFPHRGARATGYLMGESEDAETGRPLACVYIPIALFPPSGYTLLFPREDVTTTHWEATAPWKLLLSGGLTVPKKVPFEMSDASTAAAPERPL